MKAVIQRIGGRMSTRDWGIVAVLFVAGAIREPITVLFTIVGALLWCHGGCVTRAIGFYLLVASAIAILS